MAGKKKVARRFAVCVKNRGYEAALERNKIYVLLSDADAAKDGDVRVIDESGEDYLVLCVRSGTYKASLQPRKVYRVVEDPRAEARQLLRVIDESGERLPPARLHPGAAVASLRRGRAV